MRKLRFSLAFSLSLCICYCVRSANESLKISRLGKLSQIFRVIYAIKEPLFFVVSLTCLLTFSRFRFRADSHLHSRRGERGQSLGCDPYRCVWAASLTFFLLAPIQSLMNHSTSSLDCMTLITSTMHAKNGALLCSRVCCVDFDCVLMQF